MLTAIFASRQLVVASGLLARAPLGRVNLHALPKPTPNNKRHILTLTMIDVAVEIFICIFIAKDIHRCCG